jgi:hypothetical protein
MLMAAAVLGLAGCDERAPRPVPETPPAAPAPVEAAPGPASVAGRFQIELPVGWTTLPGMDDRSTELRGPSLASIPDDPLAQRALVREREGIRGSTLELALDDFRTADARDESVEVQIHQRDDRSIVERLETNLTEVEFEGTREHRRFVKATYFIYLARGPDEFDAVEISFLETTESIFLRDRDTLRGMVWSLRRMSSP